MSEENPELALARNMAVNIDHNSPFSAEPLKELIDAYIDQKITIEKQQADIRRLEEELEIATKAGNWDEDLKRLYREDVQELVNKFEPVAEWLNNWDLPFVPDDEWNEDYQTFLAAIKKHTKESG